MKTNITAKILADSITVGAHRLTTFELTYPRFIHSELMTHRMLSRNSASSRAIPTAKLRERIMNDPAVTVHWGKNQKGMQADEELSEEQQIRAMDLWLQARAVAVGPHMAAEELGLHKQIANRLVEPWMMITVICSATEWANFFALRRHKDAEPNFQVLANAMWDCYTSSTPTFKKRGEWHLPFVTDDDWADPGMRAKNDLGVPNGAQVSAGCCARVSYLTHDGTREPVKDIELCNRLASNDPMHASPLEHPAVAAPDGVYNVNTGKFDPPRYGNFVGWKQLRQFYAREAGPSTNEKCPTCGLWDGCEPRHTKGCTHGA